MMTFLYYGPKNFELRPIRHHRLYAPDGAELMFDVEIFVVLQNDKFHFIL